MEKVKFYKKYILIGLLISIIVLVAGLYIIKKRVISNNIITKAPATVNYFTVLAVSPSNSSNENPQDSSIKITFSEPIDPNNLKSYFTVNPMIPGTFTQGATPNEVVFNAKYSFGYGTSVKVLLNKGFQSISGDKFTSDYSFNFYTKILDNKVSFQSDSIVSRVTNLPIGKGISFKLSVGSTVSSDGNITVYKATFDQLVSALLYKNQANAGSSYVTQSYIDYPVDTSKMQKISQKKGLENNSTFDFNEGAGLYYVEAASDNKAVGSTWINVTNEGLIVKQDDQKIAIATQNIQTGDTNQDTKILLYNLKDQPTLLNISQVNGYEEVPIQYPQTVDLVVGQTQNGIILAPVSIPQTQADIRVTKDLSKFDKVFIYTDKPTYLQGDIVKFAGTLREDNDGQYKLPVSASTVHIWIQDPTNATKNVFDQNVNVADDGSFSGQFSLPTSLVPDPNTNYLSTTLYASNSRSYTTFDIVSENTKEKISVTFDKDKYLKNEGITAHITATDTAGAPLANQELTYSTYSKDYYENDPSSVADFGTDWGVRKVENQTLFLDQNGKADVKIDQIESTISQAVTLEANLPVAGGNMSGAKTVLVQQGNLVLTFGSSRQNYRSGDTTINRVYAKDLSGNPVPNLNLHYQLYKTAYDNSSSGYKETTLNEGNVTTDGNGYVLINQVATSNPGDITIRVTATDSVNNKVESERTMTLLDNKIVSTGIYYHEFELTNLDVSTDKLSYNVGDTAHLVINSPFDENVLVTYERGRIYYSQWFTLHKGDNIYTVNINQQLAPSFNIVFSYFHNGSWFVEGFPLNVLDSSKNLQLSLSQNSGQLLITTKDSTGQGVSANVSVDILENNIFGLRNHLPSGDINWFFNQPRMDTTNFSASVIGIGTGSGCGGGSGIDINYVPNRIGDNIYWNPNLATDQNGQLQIPLPASTGGTIRVIVNALTKTTSVAQSQLTF